MATPAESIIKSNGSSPHKESSSQVGNKVTEVPAIEGFSDHKGLQLLHQIATELSQTTTDAELVNRYARAISSYMNGEYALALEILRETVDHRVKAHQNSKKELSMRPSGENNEHPIIRKFLSKDPGQYAALLRETIASLPNTLVKEREGLSELFTMFSALHANTQLGMIERECNTTLLLEAQAALAEVVARAEGTYQTPLRSCRTRQGDLASAYITDQHTLPAGHRKTS